MCVTAGRNTFLLREVFRPVYFWRKGDDGMGKTVRNSDTAVQKAVRNERKPCKRIRRLQKNDRIRRAFSFVEVSHLYQAGERRRNLSDGGVPIGSAEHERAATPPAKKVGRNAYGGRTRNCERNDSYLWLMRAAESYKEGAKSL